MGGDRSRIKRMGFRLLAAAIFFFSILFAPWFVTLALALVLLFLLPPYFEVLFFGFVYDSLYGAGLPSFYGLAFPATLIASVLLLSVEYIRRHLAFSSS